jgi:hypothetical protein
MTFHLQDLTFRSQGPVIPPRSEDSNASAWLFFSPMRHIDLPLSKDFSDLSFAVMPSLIPQDSHPTSLLSSCCGHRMLQHRVFGMSPNQEDCEAGKSPIHPMPTLDSCHRSDLLQTIVVQLDLVVKGRTAELRLIARVFRGKAGKQREMPI